MKQRNISIFVIVFIMCMSIFLFTACALRQGAKPPQTQPGTPQQGQRMGTELTPETSPPGTAQSQQDLVSYRQKAENITRGLKNMPGVDEVDAVVVGNTCLVGYKPSKTSKNANTIRNMIIDKVKGMDATIDTVVVNESEDTMKNIKKLSKDIIDNKPANEINAEFQKIIQKLKPAAR